MLALQALIRVFHGPTQSWCFPAGTSASDAINSITGTHTYNKDITLEAEIDGVVLPLPLGFRLQPNQGWRYQVKTQDSLQPNQGWRYQVKTQDSLQPKQGWRYQLKTQDRLPHRFGAGHAVNPEEYYYVTPQGLESLVKDLKMGKYCVLCDRRQSGKSTLALAVARSLKEGSDPMCPVYVQGMGAARPNWDASSMWTCLCDYLHLANPTLFMKPVPGSGTDRMFLSCFLKQNLAIPVTLIFDEADSLLQLSTECLDELFHTLRNMKNDSKSFNLKGFLLVGVETVKDLLEAHYMRRRAEAEASNIDCVPGSLPSRLSPFPHDHTITSSTFDIGDIVELIQQANVDSLGIICDVPQIASAIWECTSGHKGLVGTCLAFMMQEEAFSYRAWVKLSDSSKLARDIFGKATYHRMMRYFKIWTHSHYDLLAGFLEVEERVFQPMAHIRNLLAEGVLVAREHDSEYIMKISSPLLRSTILRRCSIIDQQVDRPPGSPFVVDRSWVILETIRTLHGEALCRPECSNVSGPPSEYALQFAFMCRIKAVLQYAYPAVGAIVLPEVKEVWREGARCSNMRLDSLVRDSDHFPNFGFEFLVEGRHADVLHHYDKAVQYSQQHSAQVYLLHFAMDKELEGFEPSNENVFSWTVSFNQDRQVAIVHTFECTGACKEHVVRLKAWTGRFCFDDLV